MGTIFAYSVTVSMVLILAHCGYLLSRNGSPRLRRTVLLGIYAFALVVVPVLLGVDFNVVSESAVIRGENALPPQIKITNTDASASIFDILLAIYVVGVTASLLLTVVQLLRVYGLLRGSRKQTVGGLTVYVHDRRDIAPFSIGSIVVVNGADIGNSDIMLHEEAHIARCHMIDLCIAQFTAIICWYCPSAWKLRGELKLVHEFQADEAVIGSGTDLRAYCRLLAERAARLRIMSLANSFSHNDLKQRIRMMKTSGSESRRGKMRVLLPLSAVVGAVLLLSVPAVSRAIGQISRSTLPAGERSIKETGNAFVVYGADIDSDVIKKGNFIVISGDVRYLSGMEMGEMSLENVDGVILPRIGAIFCSDKNILNRLVPGVSTYLVDGKKMSVKEFAEIPVSELWKIVVSGNSMIVYTRNQVEYKYFNAFETAVKAENKY